MEIIVLVTFGILVSAMYVSLWNADEIVHIASSCGSHWIRLGGDWMRLGGKSDPGQGIRSKAAGDIGPGSGDIR